MELRERLTENCEFTVTGGTPLEGTAFVQGAKNAVLPIIAASLLPVRGQTILHNVPPLNDVIVSLALAEDAGATVTYYEGQHTAVIDASAVSNPVLNQDLTERSRASVMLMAPLLHRLGSVEFHGVGGCALGRRGLDFHYNGFKRLGAVVEGSSDQLSMTGHDLRGNLLYLDTPSQTSTEHLMLAACLASGTTIIENAASEPEVVDFAAFLNKMGAQISGAGTRSIQIQGVDALRAIEYTVMPDRLDAAAIMMAAGITRGDVTLIGARLHEMRILTTKLTQMGVDVSDDGPIVRVRGPSTLRPVNAITWPYPGFSTDYLPGITSLAALASGTSYLRENVFEDRFTHLEGLTQMGAQTSRSSHNCAEITGVRDLRGTRLQAPDLRAGMALLTAGLHAQGETVITNGYQIERGHWGVANRLADLGAQISREAAASA